MPKAKSRGGKSKAKMDMDPTVGDVVQGLAAVEEWISVLRESLASIDRNKALSVPSMPILVGPIHGGKNC
jgi:hypothetical protein